MARRTAPAQSEHSFHYNVAKLLSVWLLPPATFTTFPAGYDPDAIRTKILRGLGLKSGWPDIQIIWNGQYYGIELKREKTGRLSKAQKERHPEIIAAGGHVVSCWTLDDVKAALDAWQIPKRQVSLQNERGDAIARTLAGALT